MPEDAHDDRLREVADELYGVAPADFVQRRDAASRAAKTDGDRALADAIAALRKPTAAAWALNSFVRSDDASLEPVFDVGARLRDAVARGDGPSIRDLMRERTRVIADVMSSIGRHAAEQGDPMGPTVAAQVERSLRAAMASADGAALVRRGILATALEESGFGALATPERDRPADDAAGRRVAAAERRLTEATGAAERAERELAASTARRAELESEREQLRRRVAEVEQRLNDARDAEVAAGGAVRDAHAELRRARAAARRAADRT